jgi:hypothetical protein
MHARCLLQMRGWWLYEFEIIAAYLNEDWSAHNEAILSSARYSHISRLLRYYQLLAVRARHAT